MISTELLQNSSSNTPSTKSKPLAGNQDDEQHSNEQSMDGIVESDHVVAPLSPPPLLNGINSTNTNISATPDDDDQMDTTVEMKKAALKCNGIENGHNGNGNNGNHSHLDESSSHSNSKYDKSEDLENEQQHHQQHLDEVSVATTDFVKCGEGQKRKRVEKLLELKQLEIDLKNEEAKLILLKRLFYSQKTGQSRSNAPNGQTKPVGDSQQQAQNKNQQNINNSINNNGPHMQRPGQNNANNINNLRRVRLFSRLLISAYFKY